VDEWVVVVRAEARAAQIWTSGCQAIVPFMEGAGGRREPGFPVQQCRGRRSAGGAESKPRWSPEWVDGI